MPAAAALLDCDINALLCELVLQRAQVIQSTVVIRVHRNPLASLRLRIDRVEPNGQPSVEVCPDGCLIERLRRSERRTRWLIRQELFRQKIVMAARVGVGPLGLNRVGTPVHEQCPVIPDLLRSSPGAVSHRNNLANSDTFSSTRVLYPIYAADANGRECCDSGGFVAYNFLGRRAR